MHNALRMLLKFYWNSGGFQFFYNRHLVSARGIVAVYYSFHIMAGLGTLFIALMGLAALLLPGGRLWRRQSRGSRAQRGARRIAPSRRITSPLSMSFSKMCWASLA